MAIPQTSLHPSGPNFGVYPGHEGIRPADHDAILAFLSWLSRKSPKTRSTYREAIAMLAGFTAERGMPLLEDLAREHLETFFNWLHARGNAPATVRNRQASLRSFYNWAVEFDVRKDHPMQRIRLEHLPDKLQPDYKPDELARVLAAIKGNDVLALRDRAIIWALFDTGLRAAELCDLRIGDRDTQGKILTVRHGKGDKQRRVPYGDGTVALLYKYLHKRSDGSTAEAPLFAQRSGEPMTFNGLRTMLERRFKAAGVAFHGVHGFRRAFAIAHLDGGGDALNLKELAGWNSLAMVYKYVRASAQERALREYRSPADRLLERGRKT